MENEVDQGVEFAFKLFLAVLVSILMAAELFQSYRRYGGTLFHEVRQTG